MNADGGNPHELPMYAGLMSNPAWSPDGTWIAFSFRSSRESPAISIGISKVDAREFRVLTNAGKDPDWSPNGTQIAFEICQDQECSTTKLGIINADGSGFRVLAGFGENPSWSPDGTMILFQRVEHPGRFPPGEEVWIIAPDGSNPRKLLEMPAIGNPVWSPDSQRIAFPRYSLQQGESGVFIIDEKNIRRIVETTGWASKIDWSPNGQWMSFQLLEDIWIVRDDGRNLKDITEVYEAVEFGPDWSP
jgi:Tol biopolymer transport system component